MPVIETLPLARADLVPFSDIGSAVVGPERDDGAGARWTLLRDAESLTVTTSPDGRVAVTGPKGSETFTSPATTLASQSFGDLVQWANNQVKLLGTERAEASISITGALRASADDPQTIDQDLQAFDAWLRRPQDERSRIVVIDGPAGIGKTTILRGLARQRAADFRATLAPLVLHIESRGKTLQSVTDLMASALQDLRSRVTYEQVMSLIRHGLVMLAIDGFDELVDPSGYDTAWGQLNELVMRTRGRAAILLAGRETMVSLTRVDEALTAVQPGPAGMDLLSRFTLGDPDPAEARRWLRETHGWTDATFDMDLVQPIFEHGSYALRPFFLAQVGPLREQIEDQAIPDEDLLIFLVQNMLRREASKFGENLEASIGLDRLAAFVRAFLQEVARELAESQTTSIAFDNLRLCAEVAAGSLEAPGVPMDAIPTLVNRSEVIAFLTADTRAGYRRFAHEQLAIHFLSEDCLRSVGSGEVPKYIRRNIWGLEALEGFARVARICEAGPAERFVVKAAEGFAAAGYADRTRQNLAALGVIAQAVANLPKDLTELTWTGVGLTELLVPPGEAPPVTFDTVTINILHAESVDLRSVSWTNVSVVTLHADDQTVPPENFSPTTVEHANGRTYRGEEARIWVAKASGVETSATSDTDGVSHDVLALLQRIERYRSFWLRDDPDSADRAGRKIISDPNWPRVREVLLRHDKAKEQNVPSSGSRAPFIHFLSREEPLSKDTAVIRDLHD